MPLAFDQFGIAWQVERLGTGVRVPKRGRSRESIAGALRRVCGDDAYAQRATEVAAELEGVLDGADLVAQLVVGLDHAAAR